MHEESADYNLLKPLAVLLEERHVARAATRYHLSQSAMSRALSRLRETFGDELLVATSVGYELTPRARALQRELAYLMPRLAALIRGDAFDPATATDTIRLHCTDYATTILGPQLLPVVFAQAPNLSLVVEPLTGQSVEDITRGRVDLAVVGVKPPAPLRWQRLFIEEHVCVVGRDHPVTGQRFNLDQLARYPHVSVVSLGDDVINTQRQLIDLGVRPQGGLRVPYFSATAAALPGTQLVAILPRRLAEELAEDPELRLVAAPEEFRPFALGLVWHPRLTSDPAQTWLRELIHTAAAAVTPSVRRSAADPS
jgi:DNA-binding transcriptional LysR family regulator